MSMTLAQMSEAEHEARMEQIRRIWADVLLLDPEDIEDGDDFFERTGTPKPRRLPISRRQNKAC